MARAVSHDPWRAPAGDPPLLSNRTLLALCIAIAASTGVLHWHWVEVPWHERQLEWHGRIVRGVGPYPDQYRVLTYFLAEGLMRLGVPFTASFVALRFVFTLASLVVFHRYLSAWVRPPFALLGLFMMAAVLPATFAFYYMQPTDPLNMLCFFLAFRWLLLERDGWLIPLTVVAMLNRETAILIPVLYALVRGGQAPARRWLPQCALAIAAAVFVALALRGIYGARPPYTNTSFLWYWVRNLTDPVGWIQVLGFFGPFLWIGTRDWRWAPRFLRRAAWLLVILFAVHFSVGLLREPRLFLPALPIVVPLTLIVLQRRWEGGARPATAV
jgi:hypothetical protein